MLNIYKGKTSASFLPKIMKREARAVMKNCEDQLPNIRKIF